jgi:hypothetical protein
VGFRASRLDFGDRNEEALMLPTSEEIPQYRLVCVQSSVFRPLITIRKLKVELLTIALIDSATLV